MDSDPKCSTEQISYEANEIRHNNAKHQATTAMQPDAHQEASLTQLPKLLHDEIHA